VVLLVAIIAAIALTTRARRGLKRQDISRQVGVKSTDRVRLVKSMGTKAP
jgi:NADH-quinone oxidoreductase subunit J